MERTPTPLGRALGLGLVFSSPVALAFVVLAAIGILDPLAALLAYLGIALALIGGAYLAALNQAALLRHLENLIHGRAAAAPRIRFSNSARELAYGIDRLNRNLLDERRGAEAKAEEIERVLERLPDPFILLDHERRILRANGAAQAFFGDNLVGQDLAFALRNPAVLEAVERAFAESTGQRVEFAIGHPVEHTFLARVEPARAPSAPGAILSLHDLTEIKRSEQMRADFVANASHEIRTPLSSLIGFIETLRGSAREDEQAREKFLLVMAEQATRMAGLVDDLLSLSRIEMREHRPPTDRIDLARTLETVIANLEWEAKGRGVSVRSDIKSGLPPAIGEEAELAQVFRNLIINAIKYGREGGEVTVRARRAVQAPDAWRPPEGALVAVAIEDQGEGIAREHIPRLTERFYRVDTARSRELGGTGLGLAIVKHVLNRHRGHLTIESEPGEGSVFTVYLPAADRAIGEAGDEATGARE
jgi:two-component system phosphate regulon sensor histidine kinase PhoR